MWIWIGVPFVVLVAALLLERLETALLAAPEHPEHPIGTVPPLTLVPPPADVAPAPRRPATGPRAARATA